MKVVDYLVNNLIENNVTDVFGVPGGVVLDFLYALDKRKEEIKVHLNYNEQASGFAACGNAQIGNRVGVAYATRGPGISNMFTSMAEAYYESIPVMFITAHSSVQINPEMRCIIDQEMDISEFTKGLMKYSCRIDQIEQVIPAIKSALHLAQSGRKGPVLLDFYTQLFGMELDDLEISDEKGKEISVNYEDIVRNLNCAISQSKRPIILIGDGIKQANVENELISLINKLAVPVISSRNSQDILSESDKYFGYIGSHGIRYANYILSKADLLISLGNRMSFPIKSESFRPLFDKMRTIRVDIDESEFLRDIPNSKNYFADLSKLVPLWKNKVEVFTDTIGWIGICNEIKDKLLDCDINETVEDIKKLLSCFPDDTSVIVDVGNNEFWVSRAYEKLRPKHKLCFSKSFGTLGNALCKAIGAYYSGSRNVVCIMGDQGFQFNIQELQTVRVENIPIQIIVVNNKASAMIRDRQEKKYRKYIHTTRESGYESTNLSKIANAYDIEFYSWEKYVCEESLWKSEFDKPAIVEVLVNEAMHLEPSIPQGQLIQKMEPEISNKLYEYLNNL